MTGVLLGILVIEFIFSWSLSLWFHWFMPANIFNIHEYQKAHEGNKRTLD